MSEADIILDGAPEALECSVCDEPIDTGYLPAATSGDRYRPLPDLAVCDACGFSEVGFAGCAPTLGDFDHDGEADALLRVEVDASGVTPTMVTDGD